VKQSFRSVAALGAVFVLMLAGSERSSVVSGRQGSDRTCASSTTLEALATCIRDLMPRASSNGFVTPTATELADWRIAVNQMLAGACDFTLPASLAGIAQRKSFADTAKGRNYCVLMEVRDADGNGFVDRGWGTFITYTGAARELSHQAPHPLFDSTTEIQAVTIFKETDSRSYLMAGAHRNANPVASTCQSSYNVADAAHNVANMFHATNAELLTWYGAAPWTAIQWHGMAADTCPNTNVYPTHGRNTTPAPSDKIVQLRDNVLQQHPAWDVDLPGAGACGLNGTDNTQGRMLNGVTGNVCTTSATSYNGRFIHIEQDPGYRNPLDWIAPVTATWPVAAAPPAAPSDLTAFTASASAIDLAWIDNSNDEEGFRLERSTDNLAFTQIATVGASVTGYSNTGLTPATTYFYRVRAYHATAGSAYSNTASATTATQAPPPPTGLTAQNSSRNIRLSWTRSAGPNVSQQRVYRSTVNGGPYTLIATVSSTATTYTNTGLTKGTTYYYVVTAVTSSGLESAYSNQASRTAK
jgi:hypothetical protein